MTGRKEWQESKRERGRPLIWSENKSVFKDVPLGCLKSVAGLDESKFENRRKRRESEGVKQRWWRVMENSLSSKERERRSEGG